MKEIRRRIKEMKVEKGGKREEEGEERKEIIERKVKKLEK